MWWRRSWFSLKGKAGIPGQRRAALLPRSGPGCYPWDPCNNVSADGHDECGVAWLNAPWPIMNDVSRCSLAPTRSRERATTSAGARSGQPDMTLAAHWRRRGSERVLEHGLIALLRLIVSVRSSERLRDTRNGAGSRAIKACSQPSPKQRGSYED